MTSTDRFIREPECESISGLSRTTRWRLEKAGKFPRRRSISPNATAWLLSEVLDWQREQSEKSTALPQPEALKEAQEKRAKKADAQAAA